MKRSIILIDCNWFYVACEQAGNRGLMFKPVVVLSNCDGMPISRNAEAKALGIKMGEPWFKIKEEAERAGVIARSSNYTLYAERSNTVMKILSEYSPNQEVYSIDECFLDFTGIRGDHTQAGRDMKAKIFKHTDLPVCVGIGETKVLAKTANHYAKKHPECLGVCNFNEMEPAALDELLAGMEVKEVWGIGKRLVPQLAEYGINTVLDLKRADPARMYQQFSVNMEKIVRELNGQVCYELEESPPAKQQIVSSRSFGVKVTDMQSIKESISLHVSEATRKLRAQDGYASVLNVFFHTSRFGDDPKYNATKTIGLPSPTNDTQLLTNIAMRVVQQRYKPGFRYHKAGVMMGDIVDKAGQQTDLFGFQATDDKSARLMAAMDDLNGKYGKGTVRMASQGFVKPWEMKREMLSPEFTTSWDGLIVAH